MAYYFLIGFRDYIAICNHVVIFDYNQKVQATILFPILLVSLMFGSS